MIIAISRLLRFQQDSGRAIASGIRHQCRTAPTGLCRARRRSIVKAAALYTNWHALGFNIDSRERVYSERQNPNSERVKLSLLSCPE